MRKKARRRKKNPVANELPKYDWINVNQSDQRGSVTSSQIGQTQFGNGRMIKRPLDKQENQIREEVFPSVGHTEKFAVGEKPKDTSDDIQSWSELLERSAQRSRFHDEFSAKSITIYIIEISAILVGAFYFAKKIMDIMNK